MNLMSLDLEFTQPSQKIFQVGAVIGDTLTGAILWKGSYYVDPHEQLSDYIKTLCHAKQEYVDGAMSLQEAYEQLVLAHVKWNCEVNCITWGGGDSEALKQQLGNPENYLFGRRWIDVKTVEVTRRIAKDQSMQGGLAKTLTRWKLAFKGTKHNAADDAENTFLLYYKMLQSFRESSL